MLGEDAVEDREEGGVFGECARSGGEGCCGAQGEFGGGRGEEGKDVFVAGGVGVLGSFVRGGRGGGGGEEGTIEEFSVRVVRVRIVRGRRRWRRAANILVRKLMGAVELCECWG